MPLRRISEKWALRQALRNFALYDKLRQPTKIIDNFPWSSSQTELPVRLTYSHSYALTADRNLMLRVPRDVPNELNPLSFSTRQRNTGKR